MSKKNIKCGYCDLVFSDLYSYALHLKDKHPRIYKEFKKDIDKEIDKEVKPK